jgi:uncharacterized membrane protein YfcA
MSLDQYFSTTTLALIAGITIVAGLAHGTLGFGFPLISTPLVALVADVKTAVLVTVLPNIIVNLISIIRGGQWRESLGKHWTLALWVVLGTLLGTRLLLTARPEPLQLLLAAMIVVFLMQDRLRRLDWSWVKRSPGIAAFGFGVTAGFLSGAVNVSVPPLVIYLLTLELSPIALTQTLNLCFLSGKAVQAASLGMSAPASLGLLKASLPLIVLAAISVFVGMRLQARISEEAYRAILRKALGAMAALLVAQVAWELARR